MTSPDGSTVVSVPRSPNPWTGSTVIALVATVAMAVGLVAAWAAGQHGLALVPAAVGMYCIGLVVYTNRRRTHPETLVITEHAVEYIGQGGRGLALTRPRSRVAWADVTGIAVVTWHKRPWIGLRTRHGARLTGPVWVHFPELDLYVMAAAEGWELPRDQLVAAFRLAGERHGAAWLGELAPTKA